MKYKSICADVAVYPDGAVQSTWKTDQNYSLSAFIENDKDGDWVLSLWKINASEYKESIGKDFLFDHKEEYTILTSVCVLALAQLQKSPAFLNRLCVGSNDSWIRDNYIGDWQSLFSNHDCKINLVDSNTPTRITSTERWEFEAELDETYQV